MTATRFKSISTDRWLARTSVATRATVLIVVTLVVAGCQHINHLRDAQESFNEAATIENKAKFGIGKTEPGTIGENSSDVLFTKNSARLGYAAALLSLKQMPPEQKAQLKKDKLWGVALTLQALAEWKLEKYDDAVETAGQAGKLKSDQLFPRDSAVVHAIPALIKIDLAYSAYTNLKKGQTVGDTNTSNYKSFKETIEPYLTGDDGAIKQLTLARGKVTSNHPINAYLIQSQLAAYVNYANAYRKVLGASPAAPIRPVEETSAAKNAGKRLKELKELLTALGGDQEVVKYWSNTHGIVIPPDEDPGD